MSPFITIARSLELRRVDTSFLLRGPSFCEVRAITFQVLRLFLYCFVFQFLNSTPNIYRAGQICFQMETVPNSDDVEYHWIGDAAASMVILFFHSDGRSSSDQLIWMHDLHKNLSNSDVHDVAIAVVEYTSTPKDCGILQLQQAAQALNWLVRDLSKKPRNVSPLKVCFW